MDDWYEVESSGVIQELTPPLGVLTGNTRPDEPSFTPGMLGASLNGIFVMGTALRAARRSALLVRLHRCSTVDKEFFRVCLKNFRWAHAMWLDGVLHLHEEIVRMVGLGRERGLHEVLTFSNVVANVFEMFAHVELLGERVEHATRREKDLLSEYQALEAELMGRTLEHGGHNDHTQAPNGSGGQAASAVLLAELRLFTIEEVITAKEQEQDIHDAHRWDSMRHGGDVPLFPSPLSELVPLPDAASRLPLPPAPVQIPNLPTSPVAPTHGPYVL